MGKEVSQEYFELECEQQVPRRDPLRMSEQYFEDGKELMRGGYILDGLVSLHLAKDHLVGTFAPHARRSLSPEKTLTELEPAIDRARAELREHGPLKPKTQDEESGADVNGRN